MKMFALVVFNILLCLSVWLHERSTDHHWNVNLFIKVHAVTIFALASSSVLLGEVIKNIIFSSALFLIVEVFIYLVTVDMKKVSRIDIALSILSLTIFYASFAPELLTYKEYF